jgi:deoxycytidylate deaminase
VLAIMKHVSISKLRTTPDKVGNMILIRKFVLASKMTGVYSDYVELTNLWDRFRKLNSSLTETEIHILSKLHIEVNYYQISNRLVG